MMKVTLHDKKRKNYYLSCCRQVMQRAIPEGSFKRRLVRIAPNGSAHSATTTNAYAIARIPMRLMRLVPDLSEPNTSKLEPPPAAGGSKVSMDVAYGKVTEQTGFDRGPRRAVRMIEHEHEYANQSAASWPSRQRSGVAPDDAHCVPQLRDRLSTQSANYAR
jgi:hypothetical protein